MRQPHELKRRKNPILSPEEAERAEVSRRFARQQALEREIREAAPDRKAVRAREEREVAAVKAREAADRKARRDFSVRVMAFMREYDCTMEEAENAVRQGFDRK